MNAARPRSMRPDDLRKAAQLTREPRAIERSCVERGLKILDQQPELQDPGVLGGGCRDGAERRQLAKDGLSRKTGP